MSEISECPLCDLIDCRHTAEYAFITNDERVLRYCKAHHPSIMLGLKSIPLKEADIHEVMIG